MKQINSAREQKAFDKEFKRAVVSLDCTLRTTTHPADKALHQANLDKFLAKWELTKQEFLEQIKYNKKKTFGQFSVPIAGDLGCTWYSGLGDILKLYYPQVETLMGIIISQNKIRPNRLSTVGRKMYAEHVLNLWVQLVAICQAELDRQHEKRALHFNKRAMLEEWYKHHPRPYVNLFPQFTVSSTTDSWSGSGGFTQIFHAFHQEPTDEQLATLDLNNIVFYDAKELKNVEWCNTFMMGYLAPLFQWVSERAVQRNNQANAAEREDVATAHLLLPHSDEIVEDDDIYGPLAFGGLLTYEPAIDVSGSFNTALTVPEETTEQPSPETPNNDQQTIDIEPQQHNMQEIFEGQHMGSLHLQHLIAKITQEVPN